MGLSSGQSTNPSSLPQPTGGFGPSMTPGVSDPELSSNYDLSKLPWPPSNINTQSEPPGPKTNERVSEEFSDSVQYWYCSMVETLVKIKQAVPQDSKSLKLAYQILNVPNRPLTKSQLYINIVLWSIEAKSIADSLVALASQHVIALGRYLQHVLAAVPGLMLMLSCFGDFRWNCFTSGTAGQRTGGGQGVESKQSGGGKDNNDDDGGGKRPPRGTFTIWEPEDLAEKKKKHLEWQAELIRVRADLIDDLQQILAVHGLLEQPQQEGGPQQHDHAPISEQMRMYIDAFLAILEAPLTEDTMFRLGSWGTRVRVLLQNLPRDHAYNDVRGALLSMYNVRLPDLQSSPLTEGFYLLDLV